MGLDLTFNLSAAVMAGMVVTSERNGTDEEIQEQEGYIIDYPSYDGGDRLEWLKKEVLIGRFPDYLDAFEIVTLDELAQVRANKWGSLYYPLTYFLKRNDIIWEES